jgi:hypothetical protein
MTRISYQIISQLNEQDIVKLSQSLRRRCIAHQIKSSEELMNLVVDWFKAKGLMNGEKLEDK